MPAGNDHIIQKVQAELTVSSETGHRKKSDQLKKAIQDALQNLAPVLDEMTGESLIRIDSLSVEITLSDVDFEQVEKKIEDAVKDKINMCLNSQLDNSESALNENVEYISVEKNHRKVLTTFLKTGQLPWWADSTDLEEAEQWLTELPSHRCKSLIRSLMTNQNVQDRFVHQLSPDVIQHVVEKLFANEPGKNQLIKLQKGMLTFLRNQNEPEVDLNEARRDLVSTLISGKLAGLPYQKLTEIILFSVLEKLIDAKGERTDRQNQINELSDWFEKSGLPEAEFWLDQLNILSENEHLITDIEETEQLLQKSEAKIETDESKNVDRRNEVSANNAGVVLLHPFLKSLFNNLGYVENGEFRNDAAMERAVCLVYYLATGKEQFPEFELQISKFLCGWPAEAPIRRFLSLTEVEKEECESVLSSCIEHWEALKNTSINGLRENFLQRTGILKREEFGWSVYIEQKTLDLLLDKLPWNLSVIKLNWMDEMLTVHWH